MEGSTAVTSSLTAFTLILVCLMASCGGNPPDSERTPRATPSYLGQQPPGEIPESFAPGIVNTDAIELNGVVAADGREFFFTRVIDAVFIMHRCQLGEDGSLYFSSDRPGGQGKTDIWRAQRLADGSFDEPVNLDPPVNSELLDYCPMGTPDGRYLFFSRRTGDSWDEADAGDVYWVDTAAIERMRR